MNDEQALSIHSKLDCDVCKIIPSTCCWHILGWCNCGSEVWHGQSRMVIDRDLEI